MSRQVHPNEVLCEPAKYTVDLGPWRKCKECGANRGHNLDCPLLTIDNLKNMVLYLRRNTDRLKGKANKWFDKSRILSGQVATLKNENNKLRAKLKCQITKNT